LKGGEHVSRWRALLSVVYGALIITLMGVAEAQTAPDIVSVSVTPAILRSRVHVTALVLTSDDVTAVVAHVRRRNIPIPEVAIGEFSGTAVVPWIPRFIHMHVPVTFTASNAGGGATSKTVSLQVN
jgi:hypothetical protein